MAIEIARRAFTVTEFNQMVETGILSEDDRVELIEGEIIEKSPIGKQHSACVDRLTELIVGMRLNLIVRVQSSIQLDDYSQPQPDLALLGRREDFYAASLPLPPDTLMVIEVADTTIQYDQLVKLPAYARSGIAEVWIVNLSAERIATYSRPLGGSYEVAKYFSRRETVASSNITALRLAVDDILG